jgi:rod shape determining protein RodA
MFSKLKYLDWPLLIAMLLLLIAGLAILYGTTTASENSGVFYRQLVFAAVGIFGFLFVSVADYHAISKQNRVLYVVFLLLLIYLIIFGSLVRGGRRWIDFGLGNLQPAEFIKLCVVLGLSRLLYLRRGQINALNILLRSIIYAGLPAMLVLLQPDLGSSLVILGIWAGLIFTSPISKKIILTLILMVI